MSPDKHRIPYYATPDANFYVGLAIGLSISLAMWALAIWALSETLSAAI